MEKILFVTFHPNPDSGQPQVFNLSESDIPDIPKRDEIFIDWCQSSAYNFYLDYMENEDEEDEDSEYNEDNEDNVKRCFDEHGNYHIYYAVYFVILNEGETPEEFRESIDEHIHSDFGVEFSPSGFAEYLKEKKLVETAIVILENKERK